VCGRMGSKIVFFAVVKMPLNKLFPKILQVPKISVIRK
jgi:hypothetical protein